MEPELVDGQLSEPCLHCATSVPCAVSQVIAGDRLGWAVIGRCPGCGDGSLEPADDGWDWGRMPDLYRQALISHIGLDRLRADPAADRQVRLRILGVLRRDSAALAEVAESYARLTGAGLVGTPAEMVLMSRRLSAVGVVVHLDPAAR